MDINDLSTMWAEDANIDETNLVGESKRIPQLHSKYYNLYYREALKVVIRQDIDKYIQSDKDIIQLSLKIDLHTANADYLEDIVKTIHSRNFIIKSMIDVMKFQAGEY